jgi:signal transduction histidine kinase
MTAINKESLRALLQASILHNIIHDLNNPLGSISLIVELQQEIIKPENPDFSMLAKQQEQIINSIHKGSEIAASFQHFLSSEDDELELFNLADNFRQLEIFSNSSFRKLNSPLKITKSDFILTAYRSDINLLIFFLIYRLAVETEEQTEILLDIKENTLIIQLCGYTATISEKFASDLAIPSDDVRSICLDLVSRNKLDLKLEKNTFFLTFNADETTKYGI